jgi:RNA polymerase sigma-70 factor (ECF subfamily)
MFAAHYGHVLAYALRRSERHVAQDVAAETFLVAWRRLDEVSELELPWLYGVARRVLANEVRSARRRGALAERASAARPSDWESATTDSTLARALGRLCERDRELLLLTAWEGLSPAEAATAIGCSRPAARVRLHRARKRLADELARAEEPLRPLTATLEEQ